MNLQVVGCSHHQSNVEMREQLAFTEIQVAAFLQQFYQLFPQAEAALLSTCNRTEFYVAASEHSQLPGQAAMLELLAEQSGFPVESINEELFCYRDRDAVNHLFRVAASLDSMVIGEAQILSQVKQAYQLATDATPRLPNLHQVFQAAIRVARRVSNDTDIHTNRVSVPSVAIGVLAKQIFERLDNKRILIIGAGEMADETLTYIRSDGGRKIVIINRTLARAEELARKFDGMVADWSDLKQHLSQADLVVSTTGATQPVVTPGLFDSIEAARQQRPMFILDLAVPRDFDPQIADRTNVYLYTLDDLQRECEYNRQSRESQYPQALKIIDQETDQFFVEVQRRSSGQTIAQLKRQAEDLKQAELARLFNRIEGLTPKDQKEIEQSFHRLVNKILHPPVKSVQSDAARENGGLLEALKQLFQLGE